MTEPQADDPRPLLARSLGQAERHVAAVTADDLARATPCADYDVRALLGHLVAVLHKLGAAGAGQDLSAMPQVVEGIADDGWPDAFRQARAEVERIWADDALLDRTVTLPWAELPGRVALDAYTHEFTAHAWDLAHATGRAADLDPELAVAALAGFQAFAPPEARGPGPFGPVVPAPEGADAYGRLAAFLGRRP